MSNEISYIEPVTLLKSELKSSDFNSDRIATNNCEEFTFHINSFLSENLKAKLTVEFSLDDNYWEPYTGGSMKINSDGNFYFTVCNAKSLRFLRIKGSVTNGSGFFFIKARGV